MKLSHPSTWFRAAAQRLDAARLLFQHSMYIDAAYLDGYVVECAIKGYILGRVPIQRRQQFIQAKFRSKKAHDFEYLWQISRNQGASIPVRIVEHIRRSAWSTDLRYAAGLGDRDDAAEVLSAGEAVLKWARNNT